MRKRCYNCNEKINLKKEEFTTKWHSFFGHYSTKGFVYKQEWWHPWCWNIEQKGDWRDRGWSDTDPAKDKKDNDKIADILDKTVKQQKADKQAKKEAKQERMKEKRSEIKQYD